MDKFKFGKTGFKLSKPKKGTGKAFEGTPEKTEPMSPPPHEEEQVFFLPPVQTVPVKVRLLDEHARMPEYKHQFDSGFDLAATETMEIEGKHTAVVRTGLVVEIPPGYELQVRPRSGVSLKTDLRVANAPGTVDSNYRGEVGVIITNQSMFNQTINKGDRIAQGVIAPVAVAQFIEVDEMGNTTRGAGGYGSTGMK
jgi:dUTP pyrophosphatase